MNDQERQKIDETREINSIHIPVWAVKGIIAAFVTLLLAYVALIQLGLQKTDAKAAEDIRAIQVKDVQQDSGMNVFGRNFVLVCIKLGVNCEPMPVNK